MSAPVDVTSAVATASVVEDDQVYIQDLMRRRKRVTRRTNVLVRVGQLAVFVVLLGIWEYMAASGRLPNAKIFYGKPSDVARFLVDERAVLWVNTKATLWAMVLGFAIGSSSAVIVGLLLGRFRIVDRIFDPLLTVLASLPRIALVPLFLLWFGITLKAKLAVSVSAVFFVVLYNTRAGVKSVDGDLQTVARLLGAPQRDIFTKVVLPGAVPVIFAGLRLGMIYAMLGTIASEMVSAESGLGINVVQYAQILEPNGVFAVLTILAVISSIFNGILKSVEHRLLRWMPDEARN